MVNKRPVLRVYTPIVDRSHVMVLKGETELYTSLRWQNCYSEAGEFEVRMPYRADMMALFKPFDIVELRRGVREKYAVVLYINAETRETGEMEITVRGRMLSWVLNWRFAYLENSAGGWRDIVINRTAPLAMTYLIYNCIEQHSSYVGTKTDFFGKDVINLYNETTGSYSAQEYIYDRETSVYDAVVDLAKQNNVGFWATVEDSTLAVHVMDYNEQNVRIGIEYGNVSSMNYTQSIDNYVNCICTQTAQSPYNISFGASDMYAIVKYVNTDDVDTGDDIIPDSVRMRAAKDRFAQNRQVESISVELAQTGLYYLEDYNIGDVVTVQSADFDIRAAFPVSSVTEVWEDGYSIQVQFGEAMLNSYKKLKNEVKKR